MSEIKLKVIAVSQLEGYQIGTELEEKSLPLSQAEAYFERIRKHKPSARLMIPTEDSGYAFDSLGKLKKDGNFIYNKFGRLQMKEDVKNPKK